MVSSRVRVHPFLIFHLLTPGQPAWGQPSHDTSNTMRSQFAGPATPFKIDWMVTPFQGIAAVPLVGGSSTGKINRFNNKFDNSFTAFVPTQSNVLTAFDRLEGQDMWSTNLGFNMD